MTITAGWADLEPGTVIVRRAHQMVLKTSEDVRDLVEILAKPDTGEAHMVHTGRPKWRNEFSDELEDDNQVFIGTCGGFWYMEYFDPTNWSQLVGDPISPEWHTVHSGHFFAGTGVSMDTIIKAITEFMVTAERPTCVEWRECN
jgi:hypothetical protein